MDCRLTGELWGCAGRMVADLMGVRVRWQNTHPSTSAPGPAEHALEACVSCFQFARIFSILVQ